MAVEPNALPMESPASGMEKRAISASGNEIHIISYMNFALFICIFPIDSAWYMVAQVAGVPKIPVGFMALALEFVLFVPYCFIRFRDFRIYIYILLIFFIFSGFSASLSLYFDWEWAILFTRYAGMLACGYYISVSGITEEKAPRFIIVISTFLCVLLSISYLGSGWDSDDEFNYLRTASSLLIISSISLFSVNKIYFKSIIYIGAAFGLILVNSRTYLYIWLFVPAIFYFSKWMGPNFFKNRVIIYWSVSIVIFLIVAYIGFVWILPEIATSGNSRLLPQVDFLSSGGGLSGFETNDASINMRLELNRIGWQDIIENPFWGKYNGFFYYYGPGGYMHSIFSYWQQFGIVPFIIVVFFVFKSLQKCFAAGDRPESTPVKVLLLASIVAALLARAYTSTELFFALGLALGLTALKQGRSRNERLSGSRRAAPISPGMRRR